MIIVSIVKDVDVVVTNRTIHVEWCKTSGHWPLGWEGDVNIGSPAMRLARAISKAIVRSCREARSYKIVECFEAGEVKFYLEPWEFSSPTDGKTIVGVFI